MDPDASFAAGDKPLPSLLLAVHQDSSAVEGAVTVFLEHDASASAVEHECCNVLAAAVRAGGISLVGYETPIPMVDLALDDSRCDDQSHVLAALVQTGAGSIGS